MDFFFGADFSDKQKNLPHFLKGSQQSHSAKNKCPAGVERPGGPRIPSERRWTQLFGG